MLNDKFRVDIQKKIDGAKAKTDLFYKKLLIEIDNRLVLKSPVDKGRFRANWIVGNGFENKSTNQSHDKSGNATTARNTATITLAKITGQKIFITNSLPYAARLEYEGWSKQAPGGMVRITLAELGTLVTGIANEIRLK